MSITKTEAIVYLAYMASKSDGEYSDAEIVDAMDAMPRFYKDIKRVQSNDRYELKERSGELNELSAIERLNELPERHRIEALMVCWFVVNADGIVKSSEKEYLNKLSLSLGITDFQRVIKRAKLLTRTNVVLKVVIVAAVIFLLFLLLRSVSHFASY